VTLRQTQADLAASRSALAQLQEEEKTARQSLQLAQQNLKVGEIELQRVQQMFSKRLIARSEVDREEQTVLQLRQQVAELQGQLNTYASRMASVNAQIQRSEQQVKGQRTTLGRTEIKMPFTARIGEVAIEQGEFVSVGNNLFEALDVNGVEITAQLPVMHMRTLVSHLDAFSLDERQTGNIQTLLPSLNLTARVRLVGGPSLAVWEAQVLRFGESIDPTRRTVSIVLGVSNPYQHVIPGKRPPLLKGMYTEVELYAPSSQAMIIPRQALHQGRVYVASAENKLEIKPVVVRFHQGDLSIIDAGLREGDQVIINDLIPVIEAMPVAPKLAETVMAKIRQRAAGDIES
jgi:multidrug efflux pump subunit AcrA (membrane-fusion protein)